MPGEAMRSTRTTIRREDELPNGGPGSHVGKSKVEAEKPRPLDFDDHREALIAKLQKENRSSDYIAAALEMLDQTWKGHREMWPQKKPAAPRLKRITRPRPSWHEENRQDHSNESRGRPRSPRERGDLCAMHGSRLRATRTRARTPTAEPGESPIDRARRENIERAQQAWRTPAE